MIRFKSPEFKRWLLQQSDKNQNNNIDEIVKKIVTDIQLKGDLALLEYTNKLDNLQVQNVQDLLVTSQQIESAYREADPRLIENLQLAHDRVEDYHVRQLPKNQLYKDHIGMELGHIWNPIQKVGIYVPGGKASYPSSVIMNAVPAQVAGVTDITMVTPATNNKLDSALLVASKICGITSIYKIGGAQAISALAFGTGLVPKVDMIAGPGNQYVTVAKKQLFGQVGIDMLAGPSEVLVVSDNKNSPEWIAYDLLSQAEHDLNARSILVTDNQEFAESVLQKIKQILETLPRGEIASNSWHNNGCVIIVDSIQQAPELINLISPEHLQLAIDNVQDMLGSIKHAGAIFLGRYSTEAIGDYLAGPSHVLPTNATARFSSGISVFTFLKKSSIIACDKSAFNKISAASYDLAVTEGLHAHAMSVKSRTST